MPRRVDAVISPNERLRQARRRMPSPSRPDRCMSRGELAEAVNAWLHGHGVLDGDVDANYVGKLERGLHRWPRDVRRDAFRAVLAVEKDTDLGFYVVRGTEAITSPLREQANIATPPDISAVSPPGPIAAATTLALFGRYRTESDPRAVLAASGVVGVMTAHLQATATPAEVPLVAPAGRFFPGVVVPAQVHGAVVRDGRIMIDVPPRFTDDPFVQPPRRGLVVGRVETGDGPAWFGLDNRRARRRLADAPPGARLVMQPTYRLDELTLAVVWAVANLDECLLADDALLHEHDVDLSGYRAMSRSAASRDMAADLTEVGRMWLGSAFCADHIQRHAAVLSDVPVFWTREQRGEEGSTWLLFTHKHEYLQATAQRSVARSGALRRIFCIPDLAVRPSPLGERILLLLAAALMESYSIATVVTTEPEYAGLPGFVTDRHRHAIVANWVGADGIWHVDVTDHRPSVAEYLDASAYAAAHAISSATDPGQRLRALSDYLGVDWLWLQSRCRDLAHDGLAGIAQPRSRHLSTNGIDRACRYLAALPAGG
jgi:hypothetical protein